MIYLQNAVYAIKELRLVQTTGSQLALANGTVPTYKDYKALLKLAVSSYDRAHAPACTSAPSNHFISAFQ
jgi:hypothetical protein